ncbi:MAG: hypothetical protein ACQSGP_04690 [Frankia sp.]
MPSNPSKQGASFALWGGLEDSGGDTVLQNILNWNGSSWSIYPEYFWGGGTASPKDYQGTHITVKASDTIVSSLVAYDCSSGGHCTWSETVTDANTGQQSTSKPIGSEVAFNTLLGGVLEIHSVSGCVELPASGHAAFRDLQVGDITGAYPTPVFGNSTPDPQCSMKVTSSATSADFIWSP